jgi:iron complex outermembrane recepter protein
MLRITMKALVAVTACACLGVPALSWSDENAPEGEKLAEIVVTAQKREQNLQDVGTSLTAFDANSLQQLGLKDVTGVTGQVPGLQFNQYSATVTVYNLRGVSQNDFSDHEEAPVAVYADDAYIASTGALAGTLFDMQRVEVLRGPQGTLFGRNATGGLIQYISNQPTDRLDGYLDVSGGNFSHIDTEGAIGGPLTDTLSARGAFATNYHEGYIKNRLGGRINNQKQYAGRLQFTWKPQDNTEIRLKLHGVVNDDEVDGNYSWGASAPDATGRGVFTPGAADLGGYINPTTNPFDQAEDRRGIFNRNVHGATVHAIWKTDAFTLTSITDYLHVQKRYGEDSDISPNFIFNYDVLYHYHQLSEELRINGALDKLRWIGGFYYLHYDSRDIGTTSLIQPIGFAQADFSLSTGSPSVFAQLEYDLTSQLTLIGGARYTYDDKKFDYTYVCVNCPQTLHYVAPDYPAADRTFNIGTGKVEINYKPIRDVLLYASWNRGAKGGGWSAPTAGPVDPATLPYNLERLTSIELGLKSTFWDGRARLNGSVFHYDYKDYQGFFLNVATQVVENVNAEVKGGELEFAVLPITGLTLQMGVSHLETKVPRVPTPAGVIVPADMPQAPHWTLNALARYEWPLLGGLASVEADAKWNSKQYLELVNAPVDLEPSWAVINARAGFGSSDGRWQVNAFIKNAADKWYRIYNLDLAGFIGINQSVYAPPREYGLELRYHFGG